MRWRPARRNATPDPEGEDPAAVGQPTFIYVLCLLPPLGITGRYLQFSAPRPPPRPQTESPLGSLILLIVPTGFPFRAGATVMVISVPGARAERVCFRPQPACTNTAGSGPSALQCVTSPFSSFTSK